MIVLKFIVVTGVGGEFPVDVTNAATIEFFFMMVN